MARPLRIEFPGAVYHIMSRGIRKNPIYLDDNDYTRFLKLLANVVGRFNWLLHSYCLMENHYHLLIETPEGILGRGMKYLNSVYSQWFNRKYGHTGHLLQGRYKSRLIETDNEYLNAARYIVLNPVTAHIVDEPGKWLWSSYRATAGLSRPSYGLTVDWLLGMFSSNRFEAPKYYRDFVHAGIGSKDAEETVKWDILISDLKYLKKIRPIVDMSHNISEIPKKQRLITRPTLNELFSRIDDNNRTQRNEMIVEAFVNYGYTQTEIGDSLKLHRTTISRIATKFK